MSDRDLLGAAARAGGYTPVRWTDDGTALLLEGVQEPWNALHQNPHSDCMGDALRLAAKLELVVCCMEGGAAIYSQVVERGTRTFTFVLGEVDIDDPAAATRRAIVRAAAALTQPEGGA